MKIAKKLSILYLFIFFSPFLMAEDNSKIYDFEIVDIDGNHVSLSKFEGMPILLVNTASRCGFTPQYEGLQNLFVKYKETDLTIIAVTSNTFNQEYLNPEEIKKFCLVNYDVKFITSSPVNVKGKTAHPIFFWLKNDYKISPKWNFYKYLFDRNGKLIESWSSMTKPDNQKITQVIDYLI